MPKSGQNRHQNQKSFLRGRFCSLQYAVKKRKRLTEISNLRTLCLGALFFVGNLFAPAHGQAIPDSVVRIGTSEVRITAGNSFMQLRYRNEAVVEGQKITLRTKLAADGYEMAIFDVAPGSDACRGGIVLLRAKLGEEARFDRRLLESCTGLESFVSGNAILLVEPATAVVNGALWQVTPKEGLKLKGSLQFTPEPGTGYEDLKPGTFSKAQDLLANQAIWRRLQDLTRQDSKAYLASLTGFAPEAVQTAPNGNLVVASGCLKKESCKVEGALMIVDRDRRNLYLGFKPATGKLRSFPDANTWSEEAKTLLTRWMSDKK